MDIHGALVKEQGATFGIVVVKRSVLSSQTQRSDMVALGQRAFGPMPIVLMAQDSRGVPSYQGRHDIVTFLSKVQPARIPWNRYTLAA
jgi:hypothetical protein